jgi:hypothetical protein
MEARVQFDTPDVVMTTVDRTVVSFCDSEHRDRSHKSQVQVDRRFQHCGNTEHTYT